MGGGAGEGGVGVVAGEGGVGGGVGEGGVGVVAGEGGVGGGAGEGGVGYHMQGKELCNWSKI